MLHIDTLSPSLFDDRKRKTDSGNTLDAQKPPKRKHVTPTLYRLPTEILLLVFTFLDHKTLCTHLLTLSKRINILVHHPMLWSLVDFSQFKFNTMQDVIKFMTNTFPKKDFQGNIALPQQFPKINATDFRALRQVCPRLKGISLPSGYGEISSISNSSIKEIAGFSGLERLHIFNHAKISDDAIEGLTKKMNTLQTVILDSCHGLTNKSFHAIVKNSPKLKILSFSVIGGDSKTSLHYSDLESFKQYGKGLLEVNLEFSENVTEGQFEDFLSWCPNLAKLHLKGNCINNKVIEMISQLRNLKDLYIFTNQNLDCFYFKSATLETIHLNRISKLQGKMECPRMKSLTMEHVEDISHFDVNYEALETVRIRSCGISIDVSQWIQKMTELLSIEIFDMKSLSIPQNSNIVLELNHLRKLIVFMCEDIVDLRVTCPNLTFIHVDICMELKNLCLITPMLELAKLFVVNQSFYPKLNNLALASEKLLSLNLVRAQNLENVALKCPLLDSLNIAGCKELKSFPHLECPVLDKLALGSAKIQYSDKILENLVTNCPKISMISFSNASFLNSQNLEKICSSFVHLQALVLLNCENVDRINIVAPNLKGIQVTECQRLENVKISSLALSKMLIRNCSCISNESLDFEQTPNLKYLELVKCPKLVDLNIVHQELSELVVHQAESLMSVITDCKNLRKIMLHACCQISQLCIKTPMCPNAEIVVSDCKITDSFFDNLDPINLTTLIVKRCMELTSPTINMQNIKHLKVSECLLLKALKIKSQEVQSVSITHCPLTQTSSSQIFGDSRVDSFELLACTSLTNFKVNSHIKKFGITDCKSLKTLQLKHEALIKTRMEFLGHLTSLEVNASNLIELLIRECKNFASIGCKNVSNLKFLELMSCPRVSDILLSNLIGSCHGLKKLSLFACGISRLMMTHNELEFISIVRCNEMEQLSVGCSALKEFHLIDCAKIMDENLELVETSKLETMTFQNLHHFKSRILDILKNTPSLSLLNLKNVGFNLQEKKLLMRDKITVKF